MPSPRRCLFLPVLALLVCCAVSCQHREREDFGTVPAFSLTERGGRAVSLDDLRGKVWVAAFQFTRCSAGCPQVSQTLQRLQRDLAGRPDVVLVTFTVDPKYDNLERLRAYAENYGASPDRWLFLTGDEAEVHRVMAGLKLPRANPLSEGVIDHTFKLVLVDQEGRVRGYYDGRPNATDRASAEDAEFFKAEHEKGLRRLVRDVDALRLPAFMPRDVPLFNATLNALSAALLLLGYAAIRQRAVLLHKACMLTAVGVSGLFLASYLYYHLAIKRGEATKFTEQAAGAPEWAYYVYMGVLLSHTVLAIFVAPMALYTSYLGLRDRLARHVRLARWTLPLWLYVAVTGVVVYLMLYRAFAAGP
jgi:uncharacterized membrane protein YozB (DUF420 family)/cytochrome oxidase Cu insertion factor (SCO1/SenC/PrrC family)